MHSNALQKETKIHTHHSHRVGYEARLSSWRDGGSALYYQQLSHSYSESLCQTGKER